MAPCFNDIYINIGMSLVGVHGQSLCMHNIYAVGEDYGETVDVQTRLSLHCAQMLHAAHIHVILQELHILDAGCGTGNYTKALLDAGLGHVTMFDASSGMLQKARDKVSAELSAGRVVDINEGRLPTLPYPDSKFDAVIFSLVNHILTTSV